MSIAKPLPLYGPGRLAPAGRARTAQPSPARQSHPAESPHLVGFPPEQIEELQDLVMSGAADESAFDENGGVARIGCVVWSELESQLYLELFEDQQAASARFSWISSELVAA